MEDRNTRLSEDRTVLAAERTFAAWLRTGLAFLVAGFAALHFLPDGLEQRTLTTVLLACAAGSFGAGAWGDGRVRHRLTEPDIPLLPRFFTLGIASVLVATSVVAMVPVWMR